MAYFTCLHPPCQQASLRLMPRWATAERAILEVLSKKGNGAVGEALMAVPRTLRMMYLHAYQSYLWNLAASHRYGLQPGWCTRDLVWDENEGIWLCKGFYLGEE